MTDPRPRHPDGRLACARGFIPAEERAEIAAAYYRGTAIYALACKHNISNNAVRRIIGTFPMPEEPQTEARSTPRKKVFAADIISHTARMFGLTSALIKGRCKTDTICRARFAAVFLTREMTGNSFPQIGRSFSNRDHTTIIHARARCIEIMASDEMYRLKVERIRNSVLGVKPLQPEPRPKPAPVPVVEPVAVEEPEWSLTDDEIIERRIAAHVSAGGSFVEVRV